MNRFDVTLRNAEYLPTFSQILNAALIAVLRQHNTNAEKAGL
ncbi:transposase (class II) [Gluconobacter morbifer G707]|uniref:Transposase (Class II) n=1 Tax=Gluconobacter morbifer G707 TaxID=1088869 RepID=G6XHL5_9PROT|nr:transposase (class II) [Gluconobacter morbifer G707]